MAEGAGLPVKFLYDGASVLFLLHRVYDDADALLDAMDRSLVDPHYNLPASRMQGSDSTHALRELAETHTKMTAQVVHALSKIN